MRKPAWTRGTRLAFPASAVALSALGMGIAAAALLSGCGQRGPLYLPEHNGRVVTRPASSASSPAPDSTPASSAPGQK